MDKRGSERERVLCVCVLQASYWDRSSLLPYGHQLLLRCLWLCYYLCCSKGVCNICTYADLKHIQYLLINVYPSSCCCCSTCRSRSRCNRSSSSILISCRSCGCCSRHLSDAQAVAQRLRHAQRAQSIGPHYGGVASA